MIYYVFETKYYSVLLRSMHIDMLSSTCTCSCHTQKYQQNHSAKYILESESHVNVHAHTHASNIISAIMNHWALCTIVHVHVESQRNPRITKPCHLEVVLLDSTNSFINTISFTFIGIKKIITIDTNHQCIIYYHSK